MFHFDAALFPATMPFRKSLQVYSSDSSSPAVRPGVLLLQKRWRAPESTLRVPEKHIVMHSACSVLKAKEKGWRSSIVYRYKRRKTLDLYTEKRPYSAKPTTSAEARPPPQHGGRRGPWGLQATGLMPAALDRWGCKPPNATKAATPNLMPTFGSFWKDRCGCSEQLSDLWFKWNLVKDY